jgi:hypothetical protein
MTSCQESGPLEKKSTLKIVKETFSTPSVYNAEKLTVHVMVLF